MRKQVQLCVLLAACAGLLALCGCGKFRGAPQTADALPPSSGAIALPAQPAQPVQLTGGPASYPPASYPGGYYPSGSSTRRSPYSSSSSFGGGSC